MPFANLGLMRFERSTILVVAVLLLAFLAYVLWKSATGLVISGPIGIGLLAVKDCWIGIGRRLTGRITPEVREIISQKIDLEDQLVIWKSQINLPATTGVKKMIPYSSLAAILSDAPDFVKVLEDFVGLAKAIESKDLGTIMTSYPTWEADLVKVVNDLAGKAAASTVASQMPVMGYTPLQASAVAFADIPPVAPSDNMAKLAGVPQN